MLEASVGFSCWVIGYIGEPAWEGEPESHWLRFSCWVIGYIGEPIDSIVGHVVEHLFQLLGNRLYW